ncbi:aminoacyl-tRNA hydrolase [Litorimonas sp. WD9-15]|uniref:aminoacyl-tRNA hydrolase n=1 Tax=Litorimonas sp. WD9-15 TaxID=3418716 RepID=UPI003D0821D5
MEIWCGLGNPGTKYLGNRHNIGFMALDAIADDHGFSPWKSQFKGLVSTGVFNGRKVLLLKPSTFMNESGQAVQAALSFYKLGLTDLTVFHDELDLALGKIRNKFGGGLAGHNGLRSINKLCGGPDFHRLRLGIDHPGHKDRVASYVLSDFAKSEIDTRDDMLNGMSRYADLLAKGERDLFQTRVSEYIAR